MLERKPDMLSFFPLDRYVIVSGAIDHAMEADIGTVTFAKSPEKLEIN